MKEKAVLLALASDYPQLFLDPDRNGQEEYRRIVMKGAEPETRSLEHYSGDDEDRDETADTPAGKVRVVTLGNRKDFELVMRGLLAAKEGPLSKVPESQGAAMLTLFNWPRINAHLENYPAEERDEEFRRFTSVKENYTDMIVILSRGPYSNVPASEVGTEERRWLGCSDTIRRYHELTHVVCRRLYPDDIDALRDEMIADAVGLYAAFGCFDPELEKKFLGIRGGRYTGGRLGNYTDVPDQVAGPVCEHLERMEKMIGEHPGAEPFALIPVLMEKV